MFNLFEKENKDENKINVKENKANNYKDEGDEIVISVKEWNHNGWSGYGIYQIWISKSSIIAHTNDTIYEKAYNYYNNHRCWGGVADKCRAIEDKKNFIEYKEEYIKTYKYENNSWRLAYEKKESQEIVSEETPLEIFIEYDSKYKLIETEEEFNEYLSSTLDCNTWCRMKLYNKMKELGLGNGFIDNFADLVGNDLDKYHAMIDLANEVTDKDTLMYLYTYKFRKDKENRQ